MASRKIKAIPEISCDNNMYTELQIKSLSDLIIGKLPDVNEIILFGSYAKGANNSESDLDLAILTNKSIDRKIKLKKLAELRFELAKKGISADLLVKELSVYKNEINLPTLSKVISREGRTLWKKTRET